MIPSIEEKNIAHLSPNRSAYSETFINNRKNRFVGNTICFNGGLVPKHIENQGEIKSRTDLTEPFRSLARDYPYLSDLLHFRQSLIDERVNFVYAEYGTTAAECLPAIKSLNLPLVVHFLGYDASSKVVLTKYLRIYIDLFAYMERAIVVSKSISEALQNLGCPKEKILYVPSGATEGFFQNSPSFRRKVVLSAGRFVYKKGPQYTILAFNEVLRRHPDARLRMIGDGILLMPCRKIAKGLGIDTQVDFLGSQSHEVVRREMEESSVFVQHSLASEVGDMEGMPTCIVEAGAAGLPVVSTSHAGIPEVVQHGSTGFLVEEFDVGGMARFICELLENPSHAKVMGANARNRIRNGFTLTMGMELINDCIASIPHRYYEAIPDAESLKRFLSCRYSQTQDKFSIIKLKRKNAQLEKRTEGLKKRVQILENKNAKLRAITTSPKHLVKCLYKAIYSRSKQTSRKVFIKGSDSETEISLP